MAGIADLPGSVWPWALGAGAMLFLPGLGMFVLSHLERQRLLPLLQGQHPSALEYITARKRRLFEWTPPALRTNDPLLDAKLLRQRRLEHLGGALLPPGIALLMLANVAWMFS